MDLTIGQYVATVVLSIAGGTAVAALVNGFFARGLETRARKRELENREHTEERERQERHRALREASREAHLEEVVDVMGFLHRQQAEYATERKGYLVVHQPPAPESVPGWATAIGVLRRVSLLHSDPEVRLRCEQTVESIESAWIDPVDDPDIKKSQQWIDWLREAAELMHDGANG